MHDTTNQQKQLLRLYLEGKATPSQMEQLFALLKDDPQPNIIEREIQQTFSFTGYQLENLDMDITERINAKIRAQLPSAPAVYRIHFLRTAWFRWAAAVLLIATAISIYYTFSYNPKRSRETARVQPPSKQLNILPGSNQAILTLSNGQKIQLNNATSETIQDGTLSIENNNGQLRYKNSNVVVMNTMTTPKGGQYQLTLADGTRVWMNASSSIIYPTTFAGKIREVSITGEAYFEVAQNKEKPFIVKTSTDEITVLGTSFNINAYTDETGVKTTLVTGAVKVGERVLQPGQAYQNGNILKTNTSQDIAWKNGVFNFDRMSLAAVARQLERWYDIDVQFESNATKEELLIGKADRNLSLQDLLEGLEDAVVSFRLEGRTLFVKSL